MKETRHSPEDVAARGEAIYARDIRSKVEREHPGKFVVVDVETGEFEIDADDLAATKRALAKHPGALLYGVRVGSPTAYRLGGRFSTLPS